MQAYILGVRALILVLALGLLWFTFRPRFVSVFHRTMFVALVVAGVLKTIIIEDSGRYGATLWQLGILSVLRLKFSYVIVISLIDIVVYAVYAVVCTACDVHSRNDVKPFLIYVVFIVGYCAFGCVWLQVRLASPSRRCVASRTRGWARRWACVSSSCRSGASRPSSRVRTRL